MTVLVIGVGHPDRGDDAVGIEVVRRLGPAPGLVAWTVTADPLVLLGDPAWDEANRVVVVDAAATGAPAGTVRRWVPSRDGDGPRPAHAGSHGFGVGDVLALADALDRMPDDLEVVAIQVDDVRLGADLSPAVAAAVDDVVATLRGMVAEEVGTRVPR